jgi:DNA-binding MarR family transcriptional regulator
MTMTDTHSLLAARKKDARILAWIRLGRVVMKARSRITQQMVAHDLSPAQLQMLVQIGLAEGLTQHDCASVLAVTKGNVSQQVARLEASGLIERKTDGHSRRLFLTSQGRNVLHAVVPDHDDGVRAVLSSLSKAEVRQLSTLLKKIDRSLD